MKSHGLGLKTTTTVRYSDGSIKERFINFEEPPESTIELTKKSKEGVILHQEEIPMRSFVQLFMEWWGFRFNVSGTGSFQDMDNTTRALGYSNGARIEVNATENTKNGIQIGSDDGSSYALALDNYKLGTQLTTNVYHSPVNVYVPLVNESSLNEMSIIRSFQNNTGGSISVKETGLFFKHELNAWYFLIARDLLSSTITVDDEEVLVVTYKLKTGASITVGFLQALRCMLTEDNRQYINKDGGTSTFIYSSYENNFFDCKGSIGDDECGIVIGTGSTAVSVSDYWLDTEIEHGTGVGQMSYAQGSISAVNVLGTTCSVDINRAFTNNSGGAIVVTETGLVARTTGTSGAELMHARTLVNGGTGTSVANTEVLNIEYTYTTELE